MGPTPSIAGRGGALFSQTHRGLREGGGGGQPRLISICVSQSAATRDIFPVPFRQ